MNTIKIASIVLASLVLANCGGGGGGSETPSSQANSSTPPSTVQSSSSEAQSSEVIESSSSEAASSSSLSAEEQALLEKGMDVYAKPYESSVYSCSDCHALEEGTEGFAFDGFKRPGHTIGDALRRPHFKNGSVTEFVDAANSCLDEWMNAQDADNNLVQWTSNSEDLLALKALLESEDRGEGDAPPLVFEIGEADVPSEQGDATRGREVFNATCAICHGKDGVIPEGSRKAFDIRHRGAADAELISRRVRTSGRTQSPVYDGLTGGVMVFWAEDRVSDQELADIIAYLDSVSRDTVPTPVGGGNTGGGNSGNCGMTSPKIGQTTQLSDMSTHDVSGTATIIDDCTIEITNFNYDGDGIVVEFYGAKDIRDFVTNKSATRRIDSTDFLRRGRPYVNETIQVKLNDGQTLDDFNAISLWCSSVGIDFGSGVFQ